MYKSKQHLFSTYLSKVNFITADLMSQNTSAYIRTKIDKIHQGEGYHIRVPESINKTKNMHITV